jgi:hypothetical protein
MHSSVPGTQCLHTLHHTQTHTFNYYFAPTAATQIYFYFYSLLRAGVVSSFRARRGLPPVKAGSAEARSEDIGVAASLMVAAVAGAINMVATSPAQVGQ